MSIGSILASVSNKFTQDHLRGAYTLWKIQTAYQCDMGRLLGPVAATYIDGGNRTPAEIIQVAAPFGQKVVRWSAVRQGATPKLPDPEITNQYQFLAWWQVIPESTELAPDGKTELYMVQGTYIYHLRQPIFVQDGLFYMGGSPIDMTSSSIQVLSPGQFDKTLMPGGM